MTLILRNLVLSISAGTLPSGSHPVARQKLGPARQNIY